MSENKQKDVPICAECIYYDISSWGVPICLRKATSVSSIVTGEDWWEGQTKCWDERDSWFPKLFNRCGKDGRFFEKCDE